MVEQGIIAKPAGGLANQMNVYATARALAHQHGDVPIKLDLSAIKADPKRCLELDKLQARFKIATPEEIRKARGESRHPGLNRWIKRVRKWSGRKPSGVYRERQLAFDPVVLDLPATAYLDGNFPSARYYEPIMDLLRQEFRIRSPLSAASQAWEQRILQTTSVSLHIRRGDYAHDPRVISYHGLLPLTYYQQAIEQLLDRIPRAELFVFSDDIPWAREHLQANTSLHFVDCNGPDDGVRDFHLQCCCRHHILANSGFSRWPALLNPNEDRMVWMPQRWILGEGYTGRDVGPNDWIRVAN